MIAADVIEKAQEFQRRFQSSFPFKHVCIDGFLEPEAAEAALADFPAFDPARAINEYGEVGKKAVHTRLPEISPFYARLYDYILSPVFLDAMSAISGVDNLVPDPSMYGGGTHDNLHGQELDPHVDFNYAQAGDTHRRMNLLIYLNKNWDSRWGGDIELHSDPRNPKSNKITSFRVDFNRAVLFETNERSWHGFPIINLPEEMRETYSRKCISIYLYSKSRPSEEIAGPHGTFYVQRPLGVRFQPGYTLTASDVAELEAGYQRRDSYIEAYQRQEERVGRERQSVGRYIREIEAASRLPCLGYALQKRLIDGEFWHDAWIGAKASFEMHAVRRLSKVELTGYVPEAPAVTSKTISLRVNQNQSSFNVQQSGVFTLSVPVSIAENERFNLDIRCDTTVIPREHGLGDDERPLAFLLTSICFE